MLTLVEQFQKTVTNKREGVAIIFNDLSIEYGRMDEAVRRLATSLTKLGIGHGDRVALMLPNLPHFPICYYSILFSGATVVPLNIMLSRSDLVHILKDCRPKAIIAWGGFQKTVYQASKELDYAPEHIFLSEKKRQGSHSLVQLMAGAGASTSAAAWSENDTAVILYTSGTTGAPMGVELTQTNLLASASICRDMFLLTSNDRLMAVLPLFHPFAQTAVMNTAILAQGMMVLHHRFRPKEVLHSIEQNKVTFIAAVPSMLQAMIGAAENALDTSSLKYCITFGFPLYEEIQRQFEERFNVLVLEGYGLTEATSLVTCNRLNRERKPGSVGLPLVGIELSIFNENDEALLPGQTGEIVVRGPNVMKGYLHSPRENQQILRNGWLHTGDIGKVDEDHYFYIVDRKKDIITKGGFHIYPTEIENVALQHPNVAEAVAVGVPDPLHGEEVKLHIVSKDKSKGSEDEIIAFCREHLEVYKCPKYVQFHESFPKTTTGRILRRGLREGQSKSPNP